MAVVRLDPSTVLSCLFPGLSVRSKVAMALGDTQLAGKCRINEAYNYIWMGRYIEARRIIRNQVYDT